MSIYSLANVMLKLQRHVTWLAGVLRCPKCERCLSIANRWWLFCTRL